MIIRTPCLRRLIYGYYVILWNYVVSASVERRPQARPYYTRPQTYKQFLILELSYLLDESGRSTILENKIKKFDLNDDGFDDIITFVVVPDWERRDLELATFFGSDTTYKYYEDGFNYFRIDYENDNDCTIDNVEINKIYISCNESGEKFSTVLTPQYDGGGYKTSYSDIVVTYQPKDTHKEYVSSNSNVSFFYPDSLNIQERIYIFPDVASPRRISKIDIYDGAKIILSIDSRTIRNATGGTGASSIGLKNIGSFIRTADGNHLYRFAVYGNTDYFIYGESNVELSAVIDGKIKNGRFYKIYSGKNLTEKNLLIADQILASLQYIAFEDTKSNVTEVAVPNKLFKLPGINVSVNLPYDYLDMSTSKTRFFSFGHKDFPFYYNLSLGLEVISITGANTSGYDAETGKCIVNNKLQETEEIAGYNACRKYFAGGQSVLLIDDLKNEILKIGITPITYDPRAQTLLLNIDIDDIIKTVIWN
ncbi:hypothetical protein IIB50_02525 [Patescibacteria group bacterium]|nr:hypothetical protein [Patescibacteria group bacterium]